jgi:hypothetical protein
MAHLLASWGTGDPVPHTSWIGVSSAEGRPRMRSTNRGSISVGVGAASAATLASSKTGGSGLKPLLPKTDFRRSGFRRDPCVIEDGSSELSERLSPRPLRHRRRRGSGLKPLLPKTDCRRSGFSRNPCVIEDGGSGRKPLPRKPKFISATLSSERLPPRPLRHRKQRVPG